MITQKDILLIVQQARQYVIDQPDSFIGQLNYKGHLIWLKRRPFSKKTGWHTVQQFFSRLIALPTLYPTVTSGGPKSLLQEAERLHSFAEKNIAAPQVIVVTEEFLITEDVGNQLHHYLDNLTDRQEINRLLHVAVQAINEMHQAGLYHARPSLRDMTVKEGVVSFIDLEENPLEVMSLSQAQARDIWLFLNSAARHCHGDINVLISLITTYQQGISQETLRALNTMVKQLKPLRMFAECLPKKLLGRDGRHAIIANKAFEKCLALVD